MSLDFNSETSGASGADPAVTRTPAAGLEQVLAGHEEQVTALIKSASKYVTSLKAWKKSCSDGHVGNRQKQAILAAELVAGLPQLTQDAAASWEFDVQAYLASGEWRKELQAACTAAELRVFEEGETVVSPPVLVRAQPNLGRLQLGKVPWPTLHPKGTASYLKGLNEKAASAAASQQFLNAIYDGCKKVTQQGNLFALFRDVYDLFSYAPGWAKENSPASFAQQIYSLHRSGVRTTRDGKTFEFEYTSGKPKERDIFSVISDDGRPIRYYGIWFK